ASVQGRKSGPERRLDSPQRLFLFGPTLSLFDLARFDFHPALFLFHPTQSFFQPTLPHVHPAPLSVEQVVVERLNPFFGKSKSSWKRRASIGPKYFSYQ